MSASMLDRLLPMPRLIEVDSIDVGVLPAVAWERVRQLDLAHSAQPRAPFAEVTQLSSDPPHEVTFGLIGRPWLPEHPVVACDDVEAFIAFHEADYAKVAWAIRVVPRGHDARIEVEVRVDATDDEAWQQLASRFRIGGGRSHLIRHSLLAGLARELGDPEEAEQHRALPGDALLTDVTASDTRGITIAATPDAIWPWLVQMGVGRGGFYSIDLFDNAGTPSARDIHPELQHLALGDTVPTSTDPDHDSEGLEVLAITPHHCLVLGALYDLASGRLLPFRAPRPTAYSLFTWAFSLEPLDDKTTRLTVRARATFSTAPRWHSLWARPIHALMESAQLRALQERAEGRQRHDTWRDVASGIAGAAIMAAAFLTRFLRGARSHWGLSTTDAARVFPGDTLVAEPRWTWTHGIEIEAPASAVWPWLAQVGADRGGFYSYQWLENLAGCTLTNAERIHDEWQVKKGDAFRLHPKMPPLTVVAVEPGQWFLVFGGPAAEGRPAGEAWAAISWLFCVEPLDERRCRVVSRYRCATSDDLPTRLSLGPTLIEPIGFAMDRRMLLGIKARVEHGTELAVE